MKSWGARFVAGLKNWRSRKSDAAPDQTPDAGRGEQPDQEPIEKTSIKATPTDFDEKASRASQQVDPANAYSDVQKAEDSTEPKTPEAGGQLTPGKDLTAQEGAPVDETSDRESLVSSGTSRADQALEKQVTGKIPTKRSGRAGGKAAIRTGPKSPSEEGARGQTPQAFQELSIHGQLSQAEGAINENAATPVVPVSPPKRSRLRKPKITDEQVTEEQLAELEAENVRLKLLLHERLSAKQDNSKS